MMKSGSSTKFETEGGIPIREELCLCEDRLRRDDTNGVEETHRREEIRLRCDIPIIEKMEFRDDLEMGEEVAAGSDREEMHFNGGIRDIDEIQDREDIEPREDIFFGGSQSSPMGN